MRAVRFSRYGGPEVLEVADVEPPVPGDGQVLVRVVAADVNPGEARIREGEYAERWPATFPEGQGNTLAGVVEAVGAGVSGLAPGDRVLGSASRSTQAELVLVDPAALFPMPDGLGWDEASTVTSVGVTAWAAVRAVDLRPGETVVVSGAAGGVGHVAVQLAVAAGTTVLGIAAPRDLDYVASIGAVPVPYGDGVADRLREAAPGPIDAWVDAYGHGSVETAIALGVAPGRIDTINDAPAAEAHGTHADAHAAGMTAEAVDGLTALMAAGRVVVRMRATFALDEVAEAYRLLESPGGGGKIVLHVAPPPGD